MGKKLGLLTLVFCFICSLSFAADDATAPVEKARLSPPRSSPSSV